MACKCALSQLENRPLRDGYYLHTVQRSKRAANDLQNGGIFDIILCVTTAKSRQTRYFEGRFCLVGAVRRNFK